METYTDSGRECRPLLGVVWWALGIVAGWLKMQNSSGGPAGSSQLSRSLCSEAQPWLCSIQGLSWNPLAIHNYSLLHWASHPINWVLDIKDILKVQVMFLYPTIAGFTGGTLVDSACNVGDTGDVHLIPVGKIPLKETTTHPSYSCLGNPMNRGAWQATVNGVSRVGHDWVNKPPTANYYYESGSGLPVYYLISHDRR